MSNTFQSLTEQIEFVHKATSNYAQGAINQLLTVRNWVIGYYIVEYEQHGQDRAKYGSHLLENLAKNIAIKGMDRQMLTTCRLFYLRYPQICDSVSRRLKSIDSGFDVPVLFEKASKGDPKNDIEICDSVNRKFILIRKC